MLRWPKTELPDSDHAVAEVGPRKRKGGITKNSLPGQKITQMSPTHERRINHATPPQARRTRKTADKPRRRQVKYDRKWVKQSLRRVGEAPPFRTIPCAGSMVVWMAAFFEYFRAGERADGKLFHGAG